jgi:hypothetical protein
LWRREERIDAARRITKDCLKEPYKLWRILEENWCRRITFVTQEQIAWVWNFKVHFAHIKLQGRSSIDWHLLECHGGRNKTNLHSKSYQIAHNFKWKFALLWLLACLHYWGTWVFSLSLFVFKASLQRCLLCCIMRTHFNTHLNYYTTVISAVNPDLPGITTGILIIVNCSGLGIENSSSRVLDFVQLLFIMRTSWLELG